MKRIIPLVLLIGFIAISCRDTSKAPKALEKESMLDRAWNYYKANKCDSASTIFDSVVTEIDPA
ncbi:MAG: hypothetical protein RQ967_06440, partial [Candidatus Caldipriscus sp.]|nr:hypothetical protein [Candidatus Caldipriscus sp.]